MTEEAPLEDIEELEEVENSSTPENEDSLDVLFQLLATLVHNKDLSRSEKLEGVTKCLASLETACTNIINKSTPQTPEDFVSEISKRAAEVAVERVSELLQPLMDSVSRLEARKREED